MTSKKWKVALAGECMASRTFSQCEDPEFLQVIEKLRAADLTMAGCGPTFMQRRAALERAPRGRRSVSKVAYFARPISVSAPFISAYSSFRYLRVSRLFM